jgi:hypothetical protein
VIPYLRTEVLFCLAMNGKLSKSMVETILQKHKHHSKTSNKEKQHHRPEILQAFKYLDTKKLIKKLNKNPGPGLIHGKGRPKTYFSITEEGLKTLLAASNVPAARFWEIMHGYCKNNCPLAAEEVEEYYQIVMRRYLKYPNRGFSSELDNFYNICNESLQSVIKSKKITIKQKIMEVLAINPRITRKKLENSIDEWPDFEPDYLDSLPLSYGFGPVDIDDNGEKIYELSLAGILFILVLIYNKHIGKLKCGLYNKEFSFEEYVDKIVSNYRMKLPLTFGKWDLLTRVLKELAIYNLIMILNKAEISSYNQNLDSVILGGNKELCDGIRTISLHNAKLMTDFVDSGQRFLVKIIPKMSASDFENTWPVLNKFGEASAMLFPTHGESYTDDFFEKTEQSFAEEITALYCANLNSNIPLSAIIPKDHPLSNEHSEMLNHSPREYLSLIFQRDKEKPSLKEWFSSWMNDLTSLQQEILQNTKKAGTFI